MKGNFANQTPWGVSYTITTPEFVLDTTQLKPEALVELSNISNSSVQVKDQAGASMNVIPVGMSHLYKLELGFYVFVTSRPLSNAGGLAFTGISNAGNNVSLNMTAGGQLSANLTNPLTASATQATGNPIAILNGAGAIGNIILNESIVTMQNPTLVGGVLTIPFKNETGVTSNLTVNLSSLMSDFQLISGSYNSTTKAIDYIVKDSNSSAQSTVSVPVSALLVTSVSNTATVSLSGNGSTTPLTADIIFDTDANNLAENIGSGLLVKALSTSGLQGNGKVGSEFKENFIALPSSPAVNTISVPAGFVDYRINGGIASQFSGTTNATDLYSFFLENTVGNHFSVDTGILTVGNSEQGVISTNFAKMQTALDNATIDAGYAVGQAIFAIDSATQELVLWQDPALPVWFIVLWGGDTQPAGTYTSKVKIDENFGYPLPTGNTPNMDFVMSDPATNSGFGSKLSFASVVNFLKSGLGTVYQLLGVDIAPAGDVKTVNYTGNLINATLVGTDKIKVVVDSNKTGSFDPTGTSLASDNLQGAITEVSSTNDTQNTAIANILSQLALIQDDVVQFANLASFPATGITGAIYIALDTDKLYRWNGSAYTEVSLSVLGLSPSDICSGNALSATNKVLTSDTLTTNTTLPTTVNATPSTTTTPFVKAVRVKAGCNEDIYVPAGSSSGNSAQIQYYLSGSEPSNYVIANGGSTSTCPIASSNFGATTPNLATSGSSYSVSTFVSGQSTIKKGVLGSDGNFYAGKTNTGSIIKITPAGVVSTFATGMPNIESVIQHSDGNFYAVQNSAVSLTSNINLFKITPAGIVSVIATLPKGHSISLTEGLDNAIYWLGSVSGEVFRTTTAGVTTTFATGMPIFSNYLTAIEKDSAGDFYVICYISASASTLYKINKTTGVVTTVTTALPAGSKDLFYKGTDFLLTAVTTLYNLTILGVFSSLVTGLNDLIGINKAGANIYGYSYVSGTIQKLSPTVAQPYVQCS